MVKKLTKWGVMVVAFNEVDYLEASIRMFQPFVDKIVISTGKKSWQGDVKNDGSVERVVLPLTKEFENIHLVKGQWDTEAEQRNETMRHLNECDFIFVVDADEMWGSGDINNVKRYVESNAGYNVFRGVWNTRFKKLNWRVEPKEPYRPIVVVKKRIEFFKNRETKTTAETAGVLIPERISCVEHFSYVRSSDEKIKNKISTFSHANEIVGGVDMWYQEVYLKADLDSTDLHPTDPKCYPGLIKDEVNPEVMTFLKKYSPQLYE